MPTIATNGINCALFGWSVADAEFTSTGSASSGDWEARSMDSGLVTVGYAGGCLWAGSSGDRSDALVVGAEVKFTTGFTGARRTQSDMLCVNPLTGTQGGAAPPSANAGTLRKLSGTTDPGPDVGIGQRSAR